MQLFNNQTARTSQTARTCARCSTRRHARPKSGAAGPTGCPAWLVRGAIPRLQWDDPRVDDFLRGGEPCILTGGCPLVSPLLGRWTFEYLSQHLGATPLSVHMVRQRVQAFSRHYGKGCGAGGVRPMSFAEFVRTIKQEGLLESTGTGHDRGLWRYYLQAPLLWCVFPPNRTENHPPVKRRCYLQTPLR